MEIALYKVAYLSSDFSAMKKKRKVDNLLNCKYLKMYGDFAMLLQSSRDAIKYYLDLETLYNMGQKQEPQWLGAA